MRERQYGRWRSHSTDCATRDAFCSLAPPDLSASAANRVFNQFAADRRLPLILWHDHFIGAPGGVAIIFTETAEERAALLEQEHLAGWQVDRRPLTFSHSPAALDEQIAFTPRAYRDVAWEHLRRQRRPSYGDPRREAETAQEDQD